jgi:hypothetical protein
MKIDVSAITRNFHRVGFQFKKYSPEILVISGVIGTVASTVLACKATTKVGDVIDEVKEELNPVKAAGEKIKDGQELKLKDGGVYDVGCYRKDLTIVYTHAAVKFAKLYGPAIAIGALSITSILAGNNILRKRNVALAAAYATLDKGFKEYRNNVVERFGKEVDRDLRLGVKAQEVEKTVVDENGEEKTVTETIKIVDPNKFSDFAKVYDDGCNGWSKDPEQNLLFLKLQQSFANKKLKNEGYLFLNDVYAMLGIPKTSAGQVVGWIYDEDIPSGDNFVDFGIYNQDNPKANDFVNGYERTIILDFNVDGIIYDKL